MRIKICGITQPEQARSIATLGANLLGFICVTKSPRYLTPSQIQAVVEAVLSDQCWHIGTTVPKNQALSAQSERKLSKSNGSLALVGVFANAAIEEIVQTVSQTQLNTVQLHGTESPLFCEQVKQRLPHCEIIKALRVRSPSDLEQATTYFGSIDALLLDAYHPQMLGGTGQTLDWSMLNQFQPPIPWFLAGGLNPENIIRALEEIQPDGVDVSSGVERFPGDKDLQKVRAFIQAIQEL